MFPGHPVVAVPRYDVIPGTGTRRKSTLLHMMLMHNAFHYPGVSLVILILIVLVELASLSSNKSHTLTVIVILLLVLAMLKGVFRKGP